jgi:hypothetical protein
LASDQGKTTLLIRASDSAFGQEPNYGAPPAGIVAAYRGFLLSHPGAALLVARAPGGAFVVRFGGPGACSGDACTTTVLVPDGNGGLLQAFNQQVADLKLLPPKYGLLPWLATEDGGVWKLGGSVYVEDLSSLGQVYVPSHYLAGASKREVDASLVANKWPGSAPYVANVANAGGVAPETLIITPDQKTKAGAVLCTGSFCPVWLLTPSSDGGWAVSAKTAGSGAYAILDATNAAGGHDIGIPDQYGWNQLSWSPEQERWVTSRVVANLPMGNAR